MGRRYNADGVKCDGGKTIKTIASWRYDAQIGRTRCGSVEKIFSIPEYYLFSARCFCGDESAGPAAERTKFRGVPDNSLSIYVEDLSTGEVITGLE